MAATNIFYRLPSQRGTKIASIAGTECTLDQFFHYIVDIEGLNRQDFIIANGTKVFRPSSCSLQTINLQNNSNVDILIPLLGGKGGFGSLLRAIGAQIEKTTNRDACRDLSGRRLRDIKRQDELRKLVDLKERLEEEKRKRRKEKMEKLKQQSEKSKESASIQELVSMFDDHAFNKRRLELSEILDVAVERGLINARKRKLEGEQLIEEERKKKSRLRSDTEIRPNPSTLKGDTDNEANGLRSPVDSDVSASKKANAKPKSRANKKKKNDLWLGLEGDDEEEISSDEDSGEAIAQL